MLFPPQNAGSRGTEPGTCHVRGCCAPASKREAEDEVWGCMRAVTEMLHWETCGITPGRRKRREGGLAQDCRLFSGHAEPNPLPEGVWSTVSIPEPPCTLRVPPGGIPPAPNLTADTGLFRGRKKPTLHLPKPKGRATPASSSQASCSLKPFSASSPCLQSRLLQLSAAHSLSASLLSKSRAPVPRRAASATSTHGRGAPALARPSRERPLATRHHRPRPGSLPEARAGDLSDKQSSRIKPG